MKIELQHNFESLKYHALCVGLSGSPSLKLSFNRKVNFLLTSYLKLFVMFSFFAVHYDFFSDHLNRSFLCFSSSLRSHVIKSSSLFTTKCHSTRKTNLWWLLLRHPVALFICRFSVVIGKISRVFEIYSTNFARFMTKYAGNSNWANAFRHAKPTYDDYYWNTL